MYAQFSSPSSSGIAVLQGRRDDPEAVFVVNGASRGIGAEFCRQLLERTRGKVMALTRSSAAASEWSDKAQEQGRLEYVECNLEDQGSIEQAAASVSKNNKRCDMLINVAGVLGVPNAEGVERKEGHTTASMGSPERALRYVDRDWLRRSFEVNAFGHLMLTQALQPLILETARHLKKAHEGTDKGTGAVIANLSARVGSIGDNKLGGWWSYRMSKAALNMATKNMALEMSRHGVVCVSLHPGTVATDLSLPFSSNIKPNKKLSVDESVSMMLAVLDGLEPQHNGGFYDYDAKPIMW